MVTVYDSGYLFRYVDEKELCFILKNGFVYSTTNPTGTYWTTLLTDDPHIARDLLAIDKRVIYRVGGFKLSDIDPKHIKYIGRVKPWKNYRGGAIEILIDIPIPIISIYDLNTQSVVASDLNGTFTARRTFNCP